MHVSAPHHQRLLLLLVLSARFNSAAGAPRARACVCTFVYDWMSVHFACVASAATTNPSYTSSFSLPRVNSAAGAPRARACVCTCVYDCMSVHLACVVAVNTCLGLPPPPPPPTILLFSPLPHPPSLSLSFSSSSSSSNVSLRYVSREARTRCKSLCQTLHR